jgi:diguanylate cyclase (GGDEF)-like protein
VTQAQKQKQIKQPTLGNSIMRRAVVIVSILFALVITLTMILTKINDDNQNAILEESIKSELTSACIAAKNIITEDLEFFKAVDSEEFIKKHQSKWNSINSRLRTLKDDIGAKYIYALREFEGGNYFIFDTDEEAAEIFTPYEDIDQVHLDALNGSYAAGIMNSTDEWGSFNTGAIPIHEGPNVIGAVCVDFEDRYIQNANNAARASEIVLVVLLLISLGVLIFVLSLLLKRNKKMQDELYRIANIDGITLLPNRYNLFSSLKKNHERMIRDKTPYAVLFIDLDNFKQVNDNSGHEAGDKALRLVSDVLRSVLENDASAVQEDSMTARLGGDEFLQIVTGISTREAATAYVQSMLDAFMAYPELSEFIEKYQLGLSIGVSFFPEQSDDYDELIRIADVAMYYSKSHGKNSFSIYDFSMGDEIENMNPNVRRRS